MTLWKVECRTHKVFRLGPRLVIQEIWSSKYHINLLYFDSQFGTVSMTLLSLRSNFFSIQDIKLKFKCYLILCIIIIWQILLKFWDGSCPSLKKFAPFGSEWPNNKINISRSSMGNLIYFIRKSKTKRGKRLGKEILKYVSFMRVILEDGLKFQTFLHTVQNVWSPERWALKVQQPWFHLGLSNTSLGLLGFYCNLYLKNFNCFQVDQQPKSRIFLQMLYCWLQFVVNSYMEEYFNWFLVYTQHSSADEIIQKFNMCLCKNSIDWVCWGEFCPWF